MAPLSVPKTRQPARHRVREELQRMILSGQRRPGAKLRQQELASEFGVAPLVVREALLELRSRGLVETIDNRGAFVARLDGEMLLASYDVREAIEGMAARLCCPRVTRRDVRELRGLAEAIFAAAAAGRQEEAGRLDRELHDRLVHLAGNPLITRLVDQYRWMIKSVSAYSDPKRTRRQHLDILRAIEDGRADDAERHMRAHVRLGRDVIERELAKPDAAIRWL
jgi:DNA-binding GntR family transcriptional regulator